MTSYDPIAYTYDADVHCPNCAEKCFGRNERGFIAEDSEDSEGNPVGIISPWDSLDEQESCGTCLEKIQGLADV